MTSTPRVTWVHTDSFGSQYTLSVELISPQALWFSHQGKTDPLKGRIFLGPLAVSPPKGLVVLPLGQRLWNLAGPLGRVCCGVCMCSP